MKVPSSIFHVSVLIALSTTAVHGQIVVDAGRGPVVVEVPAAYDADVPTPLVVMLHSYASTADLQEAYLQIGQHVDSYGFLYMRPDGLENPEDKQYWNATEACCDFYSEFPDDVGYVLALIDQVKAQLNVDPLRVHLIGHSNGGFMSYRLACEHPEVFGSIASLAGVTFSEAFTCAPAEPVHVLQIHGTLDTIILYGGGTILGAVYPSAIETVQQWAGFGGCLPFGDATLPSLDLDASLPGNETTVTRYGFDCRATGSAEIWTIVGGPHVPALSATFQTSVLDYLFDHPKPEVGETVCTSTVNSSGFRAMLTAYGNESIADDELTLIAYDCPPNVHGFFILSTAAWQFPFGDGILCLDESIERMYPSDGSSPGGEARHKLDFGAYYADVITPGETIYFQYGFRDIPGGPGGFNFSEARRITFGL